jgi:hypothetical protein
VSPAILQEVLDDGEAMTGFRTTRRARVFGRRPRLHPDKGEKRDWRSSGGAELWVSRCLLDSLRDKFEEPVKEVRQEEGKGVGGRRWRGDHCRRRIGPEMPAGVAEFGERFCSGLATDLRRGKGRWGRSPRGTYRRPQTCRRG